MDKEKLELKISEIENEIKTIKDIINNKVSKGDMDCNALFDTLNRREDQLRELRFQQSQLTVDGKRNDYEEIVKAMSLIHSQGGVESRPSQADDDPAKYSAPKRKDLKTLKEEYENNSKPKK